MAFNINQLLDLIGLMVDLKWVRNLLIHPV